MKQKITLFLIVLSCLGMAVGAYGQAATELKQKIDDSITTVIAPHTIRATNLGARMKEMVDFTSEQVAGKVDTGMGVLFSDTAGVIATKNDLPKVFDVDDFGAIPNDGLDDSGPIQAAINAAAVHGGEIVGEGEYTLTNEPDRAIEYPWDSMTTYGQQGQLYLPLARASDGPKVIKFRPRNMRTIQYNIGNADSNFMPIKSGFIIKSYENNYQSGDRLIMASGGNFYNANILVLQDMTLLLDNRDGAGARMGIVDATVGNVIAKGCFFGIDTNIQAIPYPTTANNCGLRSANSLDSTGNTFARIEDCVFYGLTCGLRISSNTYANNNKSIFCTNGLIMTVNSGRAGTTVPRHVSMFCRNSVSGLTHPYTDSSIFYIGELDAIIDTNQAYWWGSRYIIDDGNDVCKGMVFYNISLNGVQHNELFNKNGGTRLIAYPFGLPMATAESLNIKLDANGITSIGGNLVLPLTVNGIGSSISTATKNFLYLNNNDTSSTSGTEVMLGSSSMYTLTSGNEQLLYLGGIFTPASGNGKFRSIGIFPGINQTGGASGVTQGILISPSLTSASDWRSVELANTSGWGLYQSGAAAKNYFAGHTLIGSSVDDGSNILQVTGDTKITGKIVLGNIWILSGTGSPEGVISAPLGSVFYREDGGVDFSIYNKTAAGSGNTGWTNNKN